MRRCNFIWKVLTFLALLPGPALYAQTAPSVTAPTAPSVSAPTMPTISSPTIGSGFYMPGSTSNNYSSTNSSTSSSSEEKVTAASTETSTSTQKLSSSLSASDISTLDELGLLSQVANAFTKKSDSSLTSSISTITNLYSSESKDETNLKLQQVLTELESLKAQNSALQEQLNSMKNSNAAPQTTNETKVIETRKGPQPKVLRFYVNGYSVLSTCRTIYISSTQNDGSFLLTGDRVYLSDGKNRKETFYIYFKPNEASNGISSYSIACAVGQDYFNQYSFLYQMSQRENLTAYRTGNLVTLRTNDSNWQLEFLLDLGN